MPVYQNIFKKGIPSGKQLVELLERMRKVLYLASLKKKNEKKVLVENDDSKDDEIEVAQSLNIEKESEVAATVETEVDESASHTEPGGTIASVTVSQSDSGPAPENFFPPEFFVFLLLGPFSVEPLDWAVLGAEATSTPLISIIKTEQSPIESLSSTSIQATASANAGKNKDKDGTRTSPIDLTTEIKKRSVEALEAANKNSEVLAKAFVQDSEISHLEKRIALAKELGKPEKEILEMKELLYKILN